MRGVVFVFTICGFVLMVLFSLEGACGVVAVCALLKSLVDQATNSASMALPPLQGLWRRTRPCKSSMLAVSLLCL